MKKTFVIIGLLSCVILASLASFHNNVKEGAATKQQIDTDERNKKVEDKNRDKENYKKRQTQLAQEKPPT